MQKRIVMSLLVVLSPFSAQAALWFSDQPPDKTLMKEMKRSHGGYVFTEDDVYVKQLWLRRGEGLSDSAYVEPFQADFMVQDTKQTLMVPDSVQSAGHSAIRFKMPDEGYYNAYYSERSVEDGVLKVDSAKAEILKHNCRLGHNYDRALVNPNRWQDAPLDIVRLRLPDEDFHTRIRSGSLLQFSVLHQGQPVAGAKVRLETQKGWINSTHTDADGVASFQVIQDNFPMEEDDDAARFVAKPKSDSERAVNGGEEKGRQSGKRAGKKEGYQSENGKTSKWRAKKEAGEHAEHKEASSRWGGNRREDHYLVSVEYQTDEAGNYQGLAYSKTRYSTAMTGSYAPNIQVSQSKSLGLVYASAGLLTVGIGGTVYRRRRIKPFKEVDFDEG